MNESTEKGQLVLFDNGLVPVYKTDIGEYVVDGRELWKGVQSKQDFSTWVKKRLNECDAIENQDYELLHKKMEKVIALKWKKVPLRNITQ